MPTWTTEVSGESFDNDDGSSRQAELKLCRAGEVVTLRAEPNNRFDSEAVAVISARGVQIGHLPSSYKAIKRRVHAGNPVTATIASVGKGRAGLYGVELTVRDDGPPVAASPAPPRGGKAKGGTAKDGGCVVLFGALLLGGLALGSLVACSPPTAAPAEPKDAARVTDAPPPVAIEVTAMPGLGNFSAVIGEGVTREAALTAMREACGTMSICTVEAWGSAADAGRAYPLTDAEMASRIIRLQFNRNTGFQSVGVDCERFAKAEGDECLTAE